VIPVSADTRGANVASVPLAEPALTRSCLRARPLGLAGLAAGQSRARRDGRGRRRADSDALPRL